jgi:predicted Ser/Thr protein kinase
MPGPESSSLDPKRISRYRRALQLVEAALELPPGERERFLGESCGDSEIVEQARRILMASESEWLETPPVESISGLLAENSLRPGAMLGERYRIERKLGEGGFGEVYLAQDTHLHGRSVAVKRLVAPPVALDESFRTELESLSRLKHPGIVPVLNWGTIGASRFLVMDYIEGQTLREELSRGSLTPKQRLEILLEVIEAVSAAHRIGIAHCDLKPENVLIRRDGDGQLHAVIVDFGIARLAGKGVPKLSAVSGPFAAPEQSGWTGSIRGDVFSLGIVAQRMLGARRANAIRSVLEKATSPIPEERFASATEMGEALKQAIARSERRRLLTVGVAGTTALLAAGGSFWFWRKRSLAVADLPQTGPITPGHLLFPDRVSGKVLEFDPQRRAFVQAIALPPGHTFENQLVSVVVRRRDLGFIVNARQGKPVVLAFSREGQFTVGQPLSADFYQQMALDPNDPFEDTVIGGMLFSDSIVAVNPFRRRVVERCRGAKGDYLGLVVDAGNQILACEYSEGEIRRFRQDGGFEAVFARLERNSVTALALGEDGTLFAAQRQKNQISVVSASGGVARELRVAEFSGPAHVCFNPRDGLLYVGNVWNGRLVVVDASGKVAANIDLGASRAGQGCLVPI